MEIFLNNLAKEYFDFDQKRTISKIAGKISAIVLPAIEPNKPKNKSILGIKMANKNDIKTKIERKKL
jgi:hypothetical protein